MSGKTLVFFVDGHLAAWTIDYLTDCPQYEQLQSYRRKGGSLSDWSNPRELPLVEQNHLCFKDQGEGDRLQENDTTPLVSKHPGGGH